MSDEELDKRAIERIIELQEESELTPTKFAKKIGVNVATLNRWKSGYIQTMKTSTIARIANEFNVSPLWLMGFDSPKEKETKEHIEIRKRVNDKLSRVSMDDLLKVEAMIDIFLKE